MSPVYPQAAGELYRVEATSQLIEVTALSCQDVSNIPTEESRAVSNSWSFRI
jgi:hypothetical protein